MSGSRFVYVTYIRTTPEKLWAALTEPDLTRLWWCETWQDCTWTKGASWTAMIPDGRIADSGVILEIDRPRRLVFTWENQFVPEMKLEGHSTCTYDLEVVGDSVKFTLTYEIGLAKSLLIGAVSEGWPHLLASLKSLLETGKPLAETAKWPEGH